VLVHDQEANRTVMSNKIADHLLPHLNLQNITTMADQHQGVIQATINNELYEIRQFRSQVAPARKSSLSAIRIAKCWSIKSSSRRSGCMRKTSRGAPHLCRILAMPSSSR
jgi:hypothetical protein